MLRELLERYQRYDPATGEFAATPRQTRRAYARLLGLSPAHVNNVLNGHRHGGQKVVLALIRTFPPVADELKHSEAA
jgi:plasmid maintenance system antidote protein VapI